MNSKTLDDALDAVSRLKGYGLLSYELVESVVREGAHENAEAAAMVIHEGICKACEELDAIILNSIELSPSESDDLAS